MLLQEAKLHGIHQRLSKARRTDRSRMAEARKSLITEIQYKSMRQKEAKIQVMEVARVFEGKRC